MGQTQQCQSTYADESGGAKDEADQAKDKNGHKSPFLGWEGFGR